MKKKIIVIVIIVIFIIGIFYKYNDILVPLIFQNEKVGMYEMKKMQECKSSQEKSFVLNVGDYEIILPLPNGAVEFKNDVYSNSNQYLISKKYGDIVDYLENVLPANDFSVTRLGAIATIKDNKNDIIIDMIIEMYTSNFMRLNYSVIDDKENNELNLSASYNMTIEYNDKGNIIANQVIRKRDLNNIELKELTKNCVLLIEKNELPDFDMDGLKVVIKNDIPVLLGYDNLETSIEFYKNNGIVVERNINLNEKLEMYKKDAYINLMLNENNLISLGHFFTKFLSEESLLKFVNMGLKRELQF